MEAIAAPPFAEPVRPSPSPTLHAGAWIAVFGLACLPIGLMWDISHHITIGRDTFWTPAHIIIQLGGIIPATMFGLLAMRTTFRPEPGDLDGSVSFWGVKAPVGVWVTIWGCMAMLTSAPFDDWWHNAYGLDVKIISPPHTILGLGMLGVGLGILLYVFSIQNRQAPGERRTLALVCAVAVGAMLTLYGDFTTEVSWPNLQHTAKFLQVACIPFPLLLIVAARAVRIRWSATIAAAVYMAIYVAMILALPLFPAVPKLAPIYHPVDHMRSPAFPLLLIIPALAFDLLELGWVRWGELAAATTGFFRRQWVRDTCLAFVGAITFAALVGFVQWHFSKFLLSDAAENRFFDRSGHWPYFSKEGPWMYNFWTNEGPVLDAKGFAGALVRAFVSIRIGLFLGNYLLRLRR